MARLPNRPSKPPKAPVVKHRADPVAWKRALELADGDARRLVVEADGSVLIQNARR